MASENSVNFFEQLPLLESFFQASEPANFHPIPDDWFVAVTDIENSTEAVNSGEYKSVNILGASSIVGLLNSSSRSQIPLLLAEMDVPSAYRQPCSRLPKKCWLRAARSVNRLMA